MNMNYLSLSSSQQLVMVMMIPSWLMTSILVMLIPLMAAFGLLESYSPAPT